MEHKNITIVYDNGIYYDKNDILHNDMGDKRYGILVGDKVELINGAATVKKNERAAHFYEDSIFKVNRNHHKVINSNNKNVEIGTIVFNHKTSEYGQIISTSGSNKYRVLLYNEAGVSDYNESDYVIVTSPRKRPTFNPTVNLTGNGGYRKKSKKSKKNKKVKKSKKARKSRKKNV